MKTLLTLWLLSAMCLHGQLPPGQWKTDLSKKSIELSELRGGGPPKDGIPAIDRPKFVSVVQARGWLDAKEPVLVVELGEAIRAYPLQILMWHEMVNDLVAGVPILASYCPLCNSAIVFDRRLDGVVYTFGVSGLLRESDMVMYDRQTDSLWQQITGESIVGSMTGKVLKRVRSQIVSFSDFSQSFPNGLVLSRDTGHNRAYGSNPYLGYEFANRTVFPVKLTRQYSRPPLERLVTVSMGETTKAYPFPVLEKKRVMEDKIRDSRYVVMFEEGTVTPLDNRVIANSRDVGSVGVFRPELDGKRLRFHKKQGKIADKQTGSTWNVLGMATDGPLAGRRLEPVEHGVYFAFAWLVFNPETKVVGTIPIENAPLE